MHVLNVQYSTVQYTTPTPTPTLTLPTLRTPPTTSRNYSLVSLVTPTFTSCYTGYLVENNTSSHFSSLLPNPPKKKGAMQYHQGEKSPQVLQYNTHRLQITKRLSPSSPSPTRPSIYPRVFIPLTSVAARRYVTFCGVFSTRVSIIFRSSGSDSIVFIHRRCSLSYRATLTGFTTT